MVKRKRYRRDVGAILAGLRMLQGNRKWGCDPREIYEIESDGCTLEPLADEGIDGLCEEINTGQWPEIKFVLEDQKCVAASLWSVGDCIRVAENMGYEITQKDAWTILKVASGQFKTQTKVVEKIIRLFVEVKESEG